MIVLEIVKPGAERRRHKDKAEQHIGERGFSVPGKRSGLEKKDGNKAKRQRGCILSLCRKLPEDGRKGNEKRNARATGLSDTRTARPQLGIRRCGR